MSAYTGTVSDDFSEYYEVYKPELDTDPDPRPTGTGTGTGTGSENDSKTTLLNPLYIAIIAVIISLLAFYTISKK